MFDVKPTQLWAGAGVPVAVSQSVIPAMTIRRATPDERTISRIWFNIAEPNAQAPEVVEFSDGSMTHAPETIAAYLTHEAELPENFTLIYLHRGAQAQCVNPLLPSLLYLTGHKGPSHALRRSGPEGLMPDVVRFAHAMTPTGGAALIIDDQQHRLAGAGRITPAPVSFYKYVKPGVQPRVLQGATA